MFDWLKRRPQRRPLRPFSGLPTSREAKASRSGPLIALHKAGRPVWTPSDYAALARAGYLKNPVVHRCIRLISEAAASMPFLLYEDGRELSDHPLLDLLERPNPRQAGSDIMESHYGHLLVAGNAYFEAVASGQSAAIDGADPAVNELYALRPDRMKVVPDEQGWPAAYEYSAGGQSVRYDQDNGELSPILHVSLFHPLDDHYGFAPLEAALTALDTHNAAADWNKALLDNAARPSGALVYEGKDGANLSEDQFERLKGELESSFQGAMNAGRPLLLEGGLAWQAMSHSPRDMDFLAAKDGAAREIALAFGVPPMLLGIPGDNTFANYQEANRVLWRQTVLPLVARTARALTHWLAPHFGDALRLWYDADEVPALTSEREAMWRRIGSADFLSDAEKREALGYSPEPEAISDPVGAVADNQPASVTTASDPLDQAGQING